MECLPRLDTKIVRKMYLLPSSIGRNVDDGLFLNFCYIAY